MKPRVFGKNSFEFNTPRSFLDHRPLCDGSVIVHDYWYLQGYQYAVAYDPKTLDRITVLDWCQEQAPNRYLLHEHGAIIFKDSDKPVEFALTWL